MFLPAVGRFVRLTGRTTEEMLYSKHKRKQMEEVRKMQLLAFSHRWKVYTKQSLGRAVPVLEHSCDEEPLTELEMQSWSAAALLIIRWEADFSNIDQVVFINEIMAFGPFTIRYLVAFLEQMGARICIRDALHSVLPENEQLFSLNPPPLELNDFRPYVYEGINTESNEIYTGLDIPTANSTGVKGKDSEKRSGSLKQVRSKINFAAVHKKPANDVTRFKTLLKGDKKSWRDLIMRTPLIVTNNSDPYECETIQLFVRIFGYQLIQKGPELVNLNLSKCTFSAKKFFMELNRSLLNFYGKCFEIVPDESFRLLVMSNPVVTKCRFLLNEENDGDV